LEPPRYSREQERQAKLAAQGIQPTPPPPTDPHYPMPPSWKQELRQLALNVYAYTQGGGPSLSAAGVSNTGMIAGPDFLMAIDATQGPLPAKGFIAAAAEIRLGRFDNWIGPERLLMDVVRWYEEWDGTLTPAYNANAVREATLEYNKIKASGKQMSEIIPLSRMEALAADPC
jgi:hypothetical protein